MAKPVTLTQEQYDSIVEALGAADDLATGVIKGDSSLHVRALQVARTINVIKKNGISIPKLEK